MKCKIPEISWHNRDPVLSVDIQPKSNSNNNYYRLASGGTDAHVLIWYMKLISFGGEYGDIELDLATDLTRHQRAVNVVKWSPSGELLASGDDESVIFIWKQKSDSEPLNILESANEQDKEVWITLKVLRGHMEDIYDLSWAPNSLYLVSGSVDNSAMIWDVQKGKSMAILNDHKGFVQGVAWDPKNQYIASLSTDRYLRIFDIQTKKVLYRVSKGTLPVSNDNNLHGKRMRLFHDDTLQTFFRRLTFTPDGKLLLTPAGVTDYDGCTSPLNTTYIFSRYSFRQPAIVLPCLDQYTVAVKCCPLLYKLRPFNAEKNPPVVPLPYRMIFAVATKSSVYFYDTQQKQPFALISNIHYTRLTDITWSNDGRVVVVSSTDGFCSLITFEKGELGEEYEDSEAALEAALAQVTKKTKKQKDCDGLAKSRKPSTDDTAAMQKDNIAVQKEKQLKKIVEQMSEGKELEVESETGNLEQTTDSPKSVKSATDQNNIEKLSLYAPESEEIEQQNETSLKQGDEKPKENIISPAKPVEKSSTAQTNAIENVKESKPISVKQKDETMTAFATNIAKEKSEKATHLDDEPKPEPDTDFGEGDETSTTTKGEKSPSKKAAIISSKVLATEIILDKEILSSEEKFESPEKKSRPVTPITIRRHPRTPSSLPQTPTSMPNTLKSQSPLSTLPKGNVTPLQDKKANPIAVRRTPRAIISSPIINTTSIIEEAMDAWPFAKESNTAATKEMHPESVEEAGITPLTPGETISERTEDIRLVYEETNEEASIKESLPKSVDVEENNSELVHTPKPETPSGNKTPRRVALKTISTPKSKKKLLD